jgi:hypothetical protein
MQPTTTNANGADNVIHNQRSLATIATLKLERPLECLRILLGLE